MRFIHFGCWNNIDCRTNPVKTYRDIVLDYIKENEPKTGYDFMIVAGDNWYNNKSKDPFDENDVKTYKFYFTNMLHSGLYKLYGIGKPCYIILGNHDENVDESHLELKKNCMLNTLKYYIDNINNGSISVTTPTLQDLADFASKLVSKSKRSYQQSYKRRSIRSSVQSFLQSPQPSSDSVVSLVGSKQSLIKNDKTKLILYECNPEVTVKKCGNTVLIFINTNIFDSKDENTVLLYLASLRYALHKHSDKRKIVVGHNQILSQSTNKVKKLCKSSETMAKFIDLLSSYYVLYLCADTHNFQITKLQNIVQVVVGTGGADPDKLPINKHIVHIDYEADHYNYEVNGYYHNSYGYSMIDIDDNTGDITVVYKHLIGTDGSKVNEEYVYKVDFSPEPNIIIYDEPIIIPEVSEDMIENNNNTGAKLCNEFGRTNLVTNTSSDIKDSSDKYCYRVFK